MSKVFPGNGSTLPGAVVGAAGDDGASDLAGATVGAWVGAGCGGAWTGDRVVAGAAEAGAVSGMNGAALGESSVGAIRGAAGASGPDKRTADSASHKASPVATAARARRRRSGRRSSVRVRMNQPTNARRPVRVPPVFSARMGTLDKAGIEALIPHRDPFLLIDRVTELEPGVRAVAEHSFTGKEWYQPGHFPGNAIVPGVILVESMAQTASVMAMASPEYRDGLGLFAGIEQMRFKRMVKPGDTARFVAETDKMRRGFARVKVRTLVGDELAAEGVILAIFQPRAKPVA